MRKVLTLLLVMAVLMILAGLALAQSVNPLDPSTWYTSAAAVIAIGTIFAHWVVKLFTALGKDWFQTNGKNTVYLSGAISVIIAGIGGYLALGYLSGQHGIMGALYAALMVLLSCAGANGAAKYDRQVAASAAKTNAPHLDPGTGTLPR